MTKFFTRDDFKHTNQLNIGDYTVDISRQIGCYAVVLFKYMDKPNYELLKVNDEIRTKQQAIKQAIEYANIAKLNVSFEQL